MTKQVNNNLTTFSNLSELGKAIGTSRQTASNKLKDKGWAGRLSFTESELSELIGSVKKTRNVKQKHVNQHVNQQLNLTTLETLQKQLETKDKQIEQLLQSLDQQQRLQLQLQKQLETLQIATNEKPKQSFWQKLFSSQSDTDNEQ